MEREPPSWLDENFLAKCIQGGEDKQPPVTVVKFSAAPAVAAGNNYTSHIYRVQVEYRVGEDKMESTSLIVKVFLTKGLISEMSEKINFYDKEPKAYSELLPEMKKKIDIDFGPTLFYCPGVHSLILKDLSEEGYTMCDRFKQLDYSHCRLVFETLAKFHATSVACHQDNPMKIEALGEEMVYKENGLFENEMKPWVSSVFKGATSILAEMNTSQTFIDMISEKSDQICESLKRLCKPKQKGLNVLNHGDLWTNNMLFKYNDSGEVADIKFIDFQVLRYASPVLDLIYFTWTSANNDVREKKLQELYDLYLETLNSTLEQLGCEERLTMEELCEDFKEATDWALITIFNVIPFILCEIENVINTEECSIKDFTTEGKFVKIFQGKLFRALLPNIVNQVQPWISL